VEVIVAAAEPHITVEVKQNISPEERLLLGRVIREPLFVASFMTSVDRAYESAKAYYLPQFLGVRGDVAIADVGWNGRMQRSLGTLLEKSDQRPTRILGLYLCLSRRVNKAPEDELRGFVADPERPGLAAFFDQYRHVFEAALSADHPTTVGFKFRNGVSRPIFGVPYGLSTQNKITLQHLTLDAFLGNVIALGRAAGRSIIPPAELVIDNLVRFLSRPTFTGGLAFEGFLFVDGQTGNETKPITRVIRLSDILMRCKDYGYWPEGTLSASRLETFAFVRRVVRGMRGKVRRALR
jgi:hypothetical protein